MGMQHRNRVFDGGYFQNSPLMRLWIFHNIMSTIHCRTLRRPKLTAYGVLSSFKTKCFLPMGPDILTGYRVNTKQ